MICLDATGQMLDSVQLSDAVFKKLEAGGSRLCFVIGGAEGLPPDLHPSKRGSGGGKSSIEYLSLSRLTFTHQVTPSGYSKKKNVLLVHDFISLFILLFFALFDPSILSCVHRWLGSFSRSKFIAPLKYDEALVTTRNRRSRNQFEAAVDCRLDVTAISWYRKAYAFKCENCGLKEVEVPTVLNRSDEVWIAFCD